MGYNNNTYVIISSSDVSGLTYSQLVDTSSSTSRQNNNASQTLIEYSGSEPDCLTGCTKISYFGRDYHTHQEGLQVMSVTGATGWTTTE